VVVVVRMIVPGGVFWCPWYCSEAIAWGLHVPCSS
jgi:hypothetical protein